MGHYNTCGWTEEQARRKTARDVLDAALAEMRADGYAQDREQAAGTADAYSDEMLAAGRNDRAEGVDDVAERIRAMQPEQKP